MGCFVVAGFLLTSASRSPSAFAELFVPISRHFYPKIWRRLEWKISMATWNWNEL